MISANIANHPKHYNVSASAIARPALAALNIRNFDAECIEALERSHYWILENAYVFNAVKYLWRCEQKGSAISDIEKALWYLERGLDSPISICWTNWIDDCRLETRKILAELQDVNR